MSRRDPYTFEERPDLPPTWRSLEDKRDPERAQKRAASESDDPGGFVSSDALMGRRSFVTLSSAAAATIGLAGCVRRPVENILPYARQPEYVVPGVPLHFATVTERLGDAIGIVVESHEGRPTKVDGNREHAASQGTTDLWAQATLMDLYDPDRSQRVMKLENGELTYAGETVAAAYEAFDEVLRTRLTEHERDGGRGLAILMQPTTSPSMRRVRQAVTSRFPDARFYTWSPLLTRNAREGGRAAFGRPVNAHYDLVGARVILALDSDVLQTETGALRNHQAFAEGRRLESPTSEMNRLYVVEPAYTVTGANADHRLRLPASDVARYAKALCRELASAHSIDFGPLTGSLGSPSTDGIPPEWIRAVAADLAAHRGRTVIVTGARQPAAVHALVHAMNRALGNLGQTVAYTPAADPDEADHFTDIRELTQAMGAGQVRTLLILGGNPVYDAPADLGFADQLADVDLTVHLSMHADETARLCKWHVPLAHELEAWGDQRALDGTVSIQQPLIAPIWGGRSALEMVAIVAGEEYWRGHSVVRRTLREAMGARGQAALFEQLWREALHSGVVPGTQLRPNAQLTMDDGAVATALAELADEATALGPENLEVTFAPCPKLLDGRHANNTWLLELPEPTTKICWDNAALVSVATARELGIESGQMLRFSREGANDIEVPAWVMPGQADNSIALTLGWGRAHCGSYGAGRGFDVYPFRTLDALGFATGVRVEPGATGYLLARTQEHGSMEGRAVAIVGDLEQYRAQPTFPKFRTVEMNIPPLWDTVDYSHDHKWGMTIDLTTCTGCNACAVACQAENNIPSVGKRQVARGREMYWLRIDRYFVGDDEEQPRMVMQPVACVQCEEAPCENVCPVNATTHSPEGLNDMAYNRCIGTRYCANNCPYKVRKFNYLTWHGYLESEDGLLGGDYYGVPPVREMQFNPNVTVRMRGVMEKCTYCVQRIQEAKIARRRERAEYRDGDVRTACQEACPSRAIVFGDLNDPESAVSRLRNRDRSYLLLAEVGTRPRTAHLAAVRNPNPEMSV